MVAVNIANRTQGFAAAGVAYPTATEWWRKWGFFRDPLTLAQVTGLQLANWLRKKGVDIDIAREVARAIATKSDGELQDAFARGQSTLAVDLVTGKIAMLRRSDVFGKKSPFRSNDKNAQVQLMIVDVQVAYRLCAKAIAQHGGQNSAA